MRSPLEYEPELVHSIGVLTVRWSLLEGSLADLLGAYLGSDSVGRQAFYALSTFSQRLALIENVAVSSTKNGKQREITASLMAKITRLWGSRNKLIHSHYVYRIEKHGGQFTTIPQAHRILGEHPNSKEFGYLSVHLEGASDAENRASDERASSAKTKRRGFAYLRVKKQGTEEYVFVNRATFDSHNERLSRRIRQVQRLTRYVLEGVVDVVCSQPQNRRAKWQVKSPRSPFATSANRET